MDPFVTLVALLFGSALFGIVGVLLAIPAAVSIQITVRELLAYGREVASGDAAEPTRG